MKCKTLNELTALLHFLPLCIISKNYFQIFTKELDEFAILVMSKENLTKGKKLFSYNPNLPKANKRFRSVGCPCGFGAERARELVVHICQVHLKCVGTMEQLVRALKMVWQKFEPEEGVFITRHNKHAFTKHFCNHPGCTEAELIRTLDRDGKLLKAHIKTHYKEDGKLKVEAVKEIWRLYGEEIKKLKFNEIQ